jgi:antitoxin component of MazEF toxin-antitoxin module
MDIVKLGSSGQVALPRGLLRRLGVEGPAYMAAEETSDGGIVLRPVGIYPIELYSDERIAEFTQADEATPEERRRIQAQLDAAVP